MRFVLTLFTVLALAGACVNNDPTHVWNDDPAGALYGHGMVGAPPILVPGRSVTVN